jgi:hypothetical protein
MCGLHLGRGRSRGLVAPHADQLRGYHAACLPAFAAVDCISPDFMCLGRGTASQPFCPCGIKLSDRVSQKVFYSAHYLISQSNFYSTFREFTTPSSKIKIGAQLVYFALYVHVWYSGLKVPDTRI